MEFPPLPSLSLSNDSVDQISLSVDTVEAGLEQVASLTVREKLWVSMIRISRYFVSSQKMYLMEKQNQGCILGSGGGAIDPCHRPQPDGFSLFLHLK